MKVTITLELGHVTHDNGLVDLKDNEDELIVRGETTKEADLSVESILGDALAQYGFEPATIEMDWSK